MKVLFLSRLYYPHVGGVELHIEKLANQLAKHKIKLTVLTTAHEQGLASEEIYQKTQIVRIPYGIEPNKKQLWAWIWENRQFFSQFDIIHAHDVFWWIWPLKLSQNLQVYTTFHGYEGVNPPRLTKRLHRKLIELNSKKTICIGDFMRQWYWTHPDLVSYGASDLANKKESQPKPDTAIYLGRLADDTGILEYLRLLRLLKKKKRIITLDIYGDGPLLTECKAYVKKQKLSVTFKGFVPHAYKYLDQYQLAFVSRYLAIIEAMQVNRLVLAHYNNQIKHDYLTCHPQAKNMHIFTKAEAIADMLVENSLYQSVSLEQAYQWATKQTWEKMAKDYLTLWGQLN